MSNPPAAAFGDDFAKRHNELVAARGEAINAYAGLEFVLCLLMAHFAEMHRDAAEIIFYRIVNTGARSKILDKLKRRRWQHHNNLFWNSLLKAVGELDRGRNEIVHWHTLAKFGGPTIPVLRPPSGFVTGSDAEIDVGKVIAFRSRCEAVTRAASIYLQVLEPMYHGQDRPRLDWLEMLQKPLDLDALPPEQ